MLTISDNVRTIIRDVQKRGDKALCDMAKRFDHVSLRPADLRVSKEDIATAQKHVSTAFLKSLKECAKNIKAFAEAEKKRVTKSWVMTDKGIQLGQWIKPV